MTQNELMPRNRVRERAYTLWEEADCSEGQAYQFWHRARRLLQPSREADGTEAPVIHRPSRGLKNFMPEAF